MQQQHSTQLVSRILCEQNTFHLVLLGVWICFCRPIGDSSSRVETAGEDERGYWRLSQVATVVVVERFGSGRLQRLNEAAEGGYALQGESEWRRNGDGTALCGYRRGGPR